VAGPTRSAFARSPGAPGCRMPPLRTISGTKRACHRDRHRRFPSPAGIDLPGGHRSRRSPPDRRRLRRVCHPHRAHFEVMFRPELYRSDDPELLAAREASFAVLYATARRGAGLGQEQDVTPLALAAWSVVTASQPCGSAPTCRMISAICKRRSRSWQRASPRWDGHRQPSGVSRLPGV